MPAADLLDGPARLPVPHLCFWNSAKWPRALRFTEKDEAGVREESRYHMRGDPWREERFRGDWASNPEGRPVPRRARGGSMVLDLFLTLGG